MKVLNLLIVLIVFSVATSFAAGTCTETRYGSWLSSNNETLTRATVTLIQVDCVADAADGSYPDTTIKKVGGVLMAVYFLPGAVTVPTNLMDMTIELGVTGFDLLGGGGADLSTAANSSVTPDLGPVYAPAPFAGDLTVKLSNNSVNSATLTYFIPLIP